MPGISFLFKKRFHPSRLDNQKRVFVTEENKKKHLEQEKELALQVAKERELQMYEGLGKAPELDPRNASLKFMYHAPAALTKSKNVDDIDDGRNKNNGNEKIDLLAKEAPVKLDENGDDDHVRAFRAKFLPPTTNNASSIDAENSKEEVVFGPLPPPMPQDGHDSDETESIEEDNAKTAAPLPTHYHQSSLEQAIGRKKQAILTAEELQARHPILKNAPTQGSYAKQTAVKHKPFHAVIRNVRCLRCGEWGHCSGDRECLLKDHNPLDFDRQLREDPMTHYANDTAQNGFFPLKNDLSNQAKSTKGNISAAQARQYFFGDGANSSSKDDSGGYISSDPEGELLKTLTRREKKLLLRKLQHLQNPNHSSAAGIDSSSDSSDSSSSSGSDSSDESSSDSSDENSRRKRKKKKHRRHRHKMPKKDHKRHDRKSSEDDRNGPTGENQSHGSGKRPRLH